MPPSRPTRHASPAKGIILFAALFLCAAQPLPAAGPVPVVPAPDVWAIPTDRSAVATETTPEGCTIERFSVHSPSMDRDIKAVVILPPEYQDHPGKRYPILHALHGMSAPYDISAPWFRYARPCATNP